MVNKKIFLIMFFGVFFFSLTSATNIGIFKIDESFQINNFCNSGDCSFMNLTSITFPNGTIIYLNEGMTKNGQEFNYTYNSSIIGEYKFKTCADPTGSLTCESDSFNLNYSGVEANTQHLLSMIFTILILLGVGFLIYRDKENIDDEKYWNRMVNKWKEKNYIRFSAIAVWYNFRKNSYIMNYLIGLLIMIVFYSIVQTYSILSIEPIIKTLLTLYSWGAVIVSAILFGSVQEWIMEWKEEVENLNWGVDGSGK